MARNALNAADVVAHAELTEIRVNEVAGRRLSADAEGSEPANDLQVNISGNGGGCEIRARFVLVTGEAELVADISALYTFEEELFLPMEVAAEFVERVGIMAVYPFIREQVFASATRLGVAAPVLGMLRAGQFTVNAHADPTPPD